MITVTVEQKQGATTRQTRVSAPSIARALQISGSGRPNTDARVVFTMTPKRSGSVTIPISANVTSTSTVNSVPASRIAIRAAAD